MQVTIKKATEMDLAIWYYLSAIMVLSHERVCNACWNYLNDYFFASAHCIMIK